MLTAFRCYRQTIIDYRLSHEIHNKRLYQRQSLRAAKDADALLDGALKADERLGRLLREGRCAMNLRSWALEIYEYRRRGL